MDVPFLQGKVVRWFIEFEFEILKRYNDFYASVSELLQRSIENTAAVAEAVIYPILQWTCRHILNQVVDKDSIGKKDTEESYPLQYIEE